jgi:hypothetical protein
MMKDGHDGVMIGRMMVLDLRLFHSTIITTVIIMMITMTNRRKIRTRWLLVIDLHPINLDGNGGAGVGQELLLLRLGWLGSLDG